MCTQYNEDPMSGPVNCHYFWLKHAAIVRLTKRNVQVQSPRVDTTFNHIIEFKAVDMYDTGLPGEQSYQDSKHPYSGSDIGNPCRDNIQQRDSRCSQGPLAVRGN